MESKASLARSLFSVFPPFGPIDLVARTLSDASEFSLSGRDTVGRRLLRSGAATDNPAAVSRHGEEAQGPFFHVARIDVPSYGAGVEGRNALGKERTPEKKLGSGRRHDEGATGALCKLSPRRRSLSGGTRSSLVLLFSVESAASLASQSIDSVPSLALRPSARVSSEAECGCTPARL